MKKYIAHAYLLCNLAIQKAHVFTIIAAAETFVKRKHETNPDTRYLYCKDRYSFLSGTFIVHSYSMLSCYLYWHVSSAGCSFVLYCVNVLTHAKTFYHFIINKAGIKISYFDIVFKILKHFDFHPFLFDINSLSK